MRIENLVSDEVKRKLNYRSKNNPKRKRNNRKRERLTEREWKELMGQYEPTYKRVRGSYQQR